MARRLTWIYYTPSCPLSFNVKISLRLHQSESGERDDDPRDPRLSSLWNLPRGKFSEESRDGFSRVERQKKEK